MCVLLCASCSSNPPPSLAYVRRHHSSAAPVMVPTYSARRKAQPLAIKWSDNKSSDVGRQDADFVLRYTNCTLVGDGKSGHGDLWVRNGVCAS